MILFHTHEDRDRIKAAAEADFFTLYVEHGGRRRGKALLCPFHKDHAPSASIHRGRFHCFVCNLTLDVFAFVGHARKTDFKGAMTYLSHRYGIALNNRVLTDADRREYARRREAADREAAELVAWRQDLLDALRNARNWRQDAYHQAKKLIIDCGLGHAAADLWADAADIYERESLELDGRINTIDEMPLSELVQLFRRRRLAA
jgi:hypothetical protein